MIFQTHLLLAVRMEDHQDYNAWGFADDLSCDDLSFSSLITRNIYYTCAINKPLTIFLVYF